MPVIQARPCFLTVTLIPSYACACLSPARALRSTGMAQCPSSRVYLPGAAVSPVAWPLPVQAPRRRRAPRSRPRHRAPPGTLVL